jgi:predicted Fe-Mo cluster-binding NifX family protein
MMIAVPSSGRAVCEHFGHCENFNLYEARDGAIVSEKSVPIRATSRAFCPTFWRTWA